MAGTIFVDRNFMNAELKVSMESGLDGRNNAGCVALTVAQRGRLNGVRPRWPEQSPGLPTTSRSRISLNGVRPRWPEQFTSYARCISI